MSLAREHALPVVPALAGLLPGGGLRRGSTVAVGGAAATSLALALCAESSATGSWAAVVGMPSLGLVAVEEAGIALERLVVVASPPSSSWATVVATLVDAFDVVLVAPPRVKAGDARRLAARLRERGAVLVVAGAASSWPLPADLRLATTVHGWEGVGDGHGHLAARRVEVVVGGRGAAARERRGVLWLPGPDGRPGAVEPAAVTATVTAVADVAAVADDDDMLRQVG